MDTSREPKEALFDPNHPSPNVRDWKVQVASERDYLYPNAHREFTPRIEAYVHRRDLDRLYAMMNREKLLPGQALARLGYLGEKELEFATRHMNDLTRRMEQDGTLDRYGWDWLKGL